MDKSWQIHVNQLNLVFNLLPKRVDIVVGERWGLLALLLLRHLVQLWSLLAPGSFVLGHNAQNSMGHVVLKHAKNGS